jgi:hypothetical protein
MSHKRLLVSAAIIAFVVFVSFTISVPRTRDIEVKSSLPAETTDVPSVTLRDSFKKGLHTISGWIEAPNACTAISASATLSGASSTESILIEIFTQSDSGVCLQVPTRTSFETTISAPVNLPITVTVNGSPATATSL